MPISLSIGLSRKVSKDYNSRGYSVNLDVELPADAINDQQSIADSADRLFALCDQLLDRQIAEQKGESSGRAPVTWTSNIRKTNGTNGRSRGGNSNGGDRLLTTAQGRAIESMARKLGRSADEYAEHEFGSVVGDLSIRQASELIDILKQEIESREKVGR